MQLNSFYRIFDKTYNNSTHVYSVPNDKRFCAIQSKEIYQNLLSILNDLNASKIVTLKQIHSNIVLNFDEIKYKYNDIKIIHNKIIGDAIISSDKNIALAVKTADCVPVLLYSDYSNFIAVAHCGWRGAKHHIIRNLVSLMSKNGARNIKAIIGPAIQQYSYEVSFGYYQDFIQTSRYYKKYFVNSYCNEYYMFDLPGFVIDRLRDESVEIVEQINEDTYSMQEKYPSYRRAMHNNEEYRQSILSIIIRK
ncbi:peptidoglycan editing factor PgeF [Rickettsia endosymbiont of Cardiosporidium cionae]|uniref:peptidoglycan editing factor PgeF n=1 Tax=Rickettsia endosymbiont of Cardiosporidium cionae TaxID=2777155 RepID=UPI001894FAB8|nr:peptidoglycan editing factor PgeF [Rickettsia endosymbiont of Cardiosporidium cionae]KAF8818260.1 peptidoglycan editing factor PgeF [Rickettsia endosymbiont of Cardiosporidium cionae]